MDFTASPDLPGIGAVIPGRAPAVSMSYTEDGTHLYVVSEADSRLAVIDCMAGKAEQAAIKCEQERIHLVCTTHHNQCVLFAGKGLPSSPVGQRNAINYLSVYDNKLLRKFRGHSDVVTGISMSPAGDNFLSISKDRTVRLWDIQQAGSVAQLELPASAHGTPHAAFDSTGLVFAVTATMADGKGQYVHLYDSRQHSSGGFAELQVPQADLEKAIQATSTMTPDQATAMSKATWNSLEFDTSGNHLIVGTDNGMTILLDGFEATVQRVFCPPTKTDRPAVSCFTPDDKTILTGNTDGTITCYDAKTGVVVKKLEGHKGPVGCIRPNPKFAQFASACTQTALWTW